MKKEMHQVHKYKRVTTDKDKEIYKCVLPGCPHYISPDLVLGRFSECWECKMTFIMNEKSITRLKPKCNTCITRRGEMMLANRKKVA